MSKNNKARIIRERIKSQGRIAQPSDPLEPKPVTNADVAFGLQSIDGYLPQYSEIPERYRNWNDPAHQLVSKLFFRGGSFPQIRTGIDPVLAMRHLSAILRSFEIKHDHKTAGAAMLLDRWYIVQA